MFFDLLTKMSLAMGLVFSFLLFICALLLFFAPKILLYLVAGAIALLGIYLLVASVTGIYFLKNTDR